jgi:hypothetical protein
MVAANQVGDSVNHPTGKHQNHCSKGVSRMLTPVQRQELHTILQSMREQMTPLIKEKKSLQLQLRGKLATPNTQWDDVSSLVASLNDNHAKITTLYAKTQLKAFQTLGVLLPLPHGRAFHRPHQPGFRHWSPS